MNAILLPMDEHQAPAGPRSSFTKKFSTDRRFLSSIIGVLVLFAAFYWYQLRPTNIRSNCALDSSRRAFLEDSNKTEAKGVERVRIENETFETYYLLCVRSQGLAD